MLTFDLYEVTLLSRIGKIQFNQKLCGVLEIPQTEFDWVFVMQNLTTVCPSAYSSRCCSWHPARNSPQLAGGGLPEEEGKEEVRNTPLVRRETGKSAGVRGF